MPPLHTFASMKHLLLVCLLADSLPSAFAQTTKSAQYCIVEADYKAKNKAAFTLITGADSATTGRTEEVNQVTKMVYEADALNYLSTHGWEVISTATRTGATGAFYATRHNLRRKS